MPPCAPSTTSFSGSVHDILSACAAVTIIGSGGRWRGSGSRRRGRSGVRRSTPLPFVVSGTPRAIFLASVAPIAPAVHDSSVALIPAAVPDAGRERSRRRGRGGRRAGREDLRRTRNAVGNLADRGAQLVEIPRQVMRAGTAEVVHVTHQSECLRGGVDENGLDARAGGLGGGGPRPAVRGSRHLIEAAIDMCQTT